MQLSIYHCIRGELINKRWTDFRLREMPSGGQLLSVNGQFIASTWEGSKGCICILNKFDPHRVSVSRPLIRAHDETISEVRFSPFIPNLLASGSEDGTVKLWQIPDEGVTKDITEESQKYGKHFKKVFLTTFHPCSRDIIASLSNTSIHVWNIQTAESYSTTTSKDSLSALDWNYNGSLLGTISRDKNAYIIDPRKSSIIMETKTHDTGKGPKFCWVDPNYFITTGFGKQNQREMKLFDIRNLSDGGLATVVIDSARGVMNPWYDNENGIIYLPSNGEEILKFYSFVNGGISKINECRLNSQLKFYTFSEKRFEEFQKNDMTRLYKYNNLMLEMVRIYVERKGGDFDPQLFPPTFSGESSISGDEWFAGEDRDRILKNIKEVVGIEGEKIELVKKESEVVESPLSVQVQMLKAEVRELKQKLEEKDQLIEKLKVECEILKEKLEENKESEVQQPEEEKEPETEQEQNTYQENQYEGETEQQQEQNTYQENQYEGETEQQQEQNYSEENPPEYDE